MNKHLLSLLLLLTLTFRLSAQWTWQNPLPPGNNFYDVQFIDSLNGWACGGYTVVKTTDGGKNWILLPAPSMRNGYFIKLFFINRNKGFLHNYGNDYQTFVTTDGGMSWDTVKALSHKYLPRMQFLNEKTGYVLQFWEKGSNEHHLFKTTDGGLTWNNYDPFPSYQKSSYSFFFLDENYGWVATDGGMVRTTDAGKTWQSSFIPNYAEPPYVEEIQFISKKLGFAACNPSNLNSITNRNCLAFTTDGGAAWEKRDMPDSYTSLSSVHFVSENTGYVGENVYPHSRIFYTTDKGATWRTLATTAENFSFIDNLKAWGLDYYNLVYTTDGWMTSRSSAVTTSTLNSVSALDTNNIAAAGEFSTILLSSDGGKTWEMSYSSKSDTISIKSIYYKNANEIWATGSGSNLIWTVDRGKNWNKIKLDAFMSWFSGIAFPDDTTGVVIISGADSGIVYTGKAAPGKSGMIWKKAHEFQFGINKIKFTRTGTGYIAGKRMLLKSIDKGATWKEVLLPFVTPTPSLDAIDNYVWITARNRILLSRDEGDTWGSYDAFYFPEDFIEISFADKLNGGAIDGRGGIIRTTDSGMTWKEDNQPVPVNSLDFADKNHGWAVGANGTILNYNAHVMGIEDKSRIKLSGYDLGQNYPNPFNPQTTIRYSIAKAGMVTLKVYDILGNEIAMLINEVKSPGEYAISFDAGKYRLSSGVYIYRIQVNDYIAAKKLLFLK